MTSSPCPCGIQQQQQQQQKPYRECCAPYHEGRKLPESPRVVLQTRYTAFLRRDLRYIIETTHPNNADYREDKVAWVRDLNRHGGIMDEYEFVSLNIENEDWSSETDSEAYITFTVQLLEKGEQEWASKSIGNNESSSSSSSSPPPILGENKSDDDDDVKVITIRERSQFLRQDNGKWLYGTGEVSLVQE